MAGLGSLPGMGSPAGDEALLARVVAGDDRALEQLYDRYAGLIYSLALRISGSADLAEDIVQETFWRVWRRAATYRGLRGQVSSWIISIAHHLAIDERRRQRTRPVPVYDQDDRPVLRELEDQHSDISDTVLADERQRLISTALASIPPEQREVIDLAYFRGLSQREIAGRLDLPIGTVKTRVRLGLQKLRDALEAQGFVLEDLAD